MNEHVQDVSSDTQKSLRDIWLAFTTDISGGTWNHATGDTLHDVAEYVSLFKQCAVDVAEDGVLNIQTSRNLTEEDRLRMYKDVVQKTAQRYLSAVAYNSKVIIDKRYFNGWREEDFTRKTVRQWVLFLVHALRAQKIASQTSRLRLTAERAGVVVSDVFNMDPDLTVLFANPTGYKFVSRYFFKGNMQSAFKSLSALMGPRFKELEWQCYFGTVEEYEALEKLTAGDEF